MLLMPHGDRRSHQFGAYMTKGLCDGPGRNTIEDEVTSTINDIPLAAETGNARFQ